MALQAITTAMEQTNSANIFVTWRNGERQNRGLFAVDTKGFRGRERSHYACS